jgi:hypothetical protein
LSPKIVPEFLVLLAISACTRAPSETITPSAQASAGCYRIALGPWRAPSGGLLEGHRGDAPDFTFPQVVQLLARQSRVPVGGHYQLHPQPTPESGFRYATWVAAPDTLVLEWSNDGVFSPMLVIRLHRAHDEYRGRAQIESDYLSRAHIVRQLRRRRTARTMSGIRRSCCLTSACS